MYNKKNWKDQNLARQRGRTSEILKGDENRKRMRRRKRKRNTKKIKTEDNGDENEEEKVMVDEEEDVDRTGMRNDEGDGGVRGGKK